MTVTFYLNEKRKQNLYGRINNGNERSVFSLGYHVSEEMWDIKRNMLTWEDPHYYTLEKLKQFLEDKAIELRAQGKDEIPTRLKVIIEDLTNKDGIDGISRYLFDTNRAEGVPQYNTFVKAFEKFSKLKPNQYKAEPIDNKMRFHTDSAIFIVDTREGLTHEINNFIDRNLYDELSMTNLSAWNEVFMDAGEVLGRPPVPKGVFYREMYSQWRQYWSHEYEETIARGLHTNNLKEEKEDSWKALQVLMACYDTSTTIIHDAYELGMELGACAILSTLNIYNKEVCLDEYCDFNFEEWDCENIKDDYFYITEDVY